MSENCDFSRLRIGLGHDTHRLAVGGPLIIGGVTIPHDRHAVGHSDADVLLHAVTDAILGAACLADIGELFPNTDKVNRGRSSVEMLSMAADEVRAAGFRILNLDCVIFAQRPKLAPYKLEMRSRIADVLKLEIEQVGLKSKTGEGVDAVGSEAAIQAQCVSLLCRESL